MSRNRHQKPKCSRGIPPSLLVSCIPLSVLLCVLLSEPMELISLGLEYFFFLNCLFSLNTEYSLSYVFFSDVFFKILVPGLCQPCQDSEPAWLKTILRRQWQCHSRAGWGLLPEALSCVTALGDAEPEQLLCPHRLQAQLWAALAPLSRLDLGEKGKNEGIWWQHKFAFGLRYSLGLLSLQQHEHLESMEIESRRWPGNY